MDSVLKVSVLDELVQETSAAHIPKFLALFFKDVPERMQRIEDAVSNQDWGVLKREAHTIGSSSATFGAIVLHDQARLIEGLCIEEAYEKAVAEVPKLQELVTQTFADLQAYQDSLSL